MRRRRLSPGEKAVLETSEEYRWRTPAGIAKLIGPDRSPDGAPKVFQFYVLGAGYHSYTWDQVTEVVKRRVPN